MYKDRLTNIRANAGNDAHFKNPSSLTRALLFGNTVDVHAVDGVKRHDWTDCTKSCGVGQMHRTRTLLQATIGPGISTSYDRLVLSLLFGDLGGAIVTTSTAKSTCFILRFGAAMKSIQKLSWMAPKCSQIDFGSTNEHGQQMI